MPPPVLATGLSGYEIAVVQPDATHIWRKQRTEIGAALVFDLRDYLEEPPLKL
jgi:hypothetical protein